MLKSIMQAKRDKEISRQQKLPPLHAQHNQVNSQPITRILTRNHPSQPVANADTEEQMKHLYKEIENLNHKVFSMDKQINNLNKEINLLTRQQKELTEGMSALTVQLNINNNNNQTLLSQNHEIISQN